jgi:hypothetical protein
MEKLVAAQDRLAQRTDNAIAAPRAESAQVAYAGAA